MQPQLASAGSTTSPPPPQAHTHTPFTGSCIQLKIPCQNDAPTAGSPSTIGVCGSNEPLKYGVDAPSDLPQCYPKVESHSVTKEVEKCELLIAF